MRMAPRVVKLKQMIDQGLLGDLLHLDAWGKQDDRRAGGEDMLVLGSHLFDLMRLIAGDVQWCTARVLQKGRDITKSNARQAGENIGPVAGDEVFAQFAFANGVNGTFNSRARLRGRSGAWGIELIGSKGSARLLTDIDPDLLKLNPGVWTAAGRTDKWEPVEGAPAGKGNFTEANRRVADDWLDAIRTDREPTCSGRNAAAAVEMVMAVYHAALQDKRIPLPLTDRKHPLA
jgi:predicted dehydrogenase